MLGLWKKALAAVLLGATLVGRPAGVVAEDCASLAVGDKVRCTDEGVQKLCKTASWGRDGTITSKTVSGCPTCVKWKRGLLKTTETISCSFVEKTALPPPPPCAPDSCSATMPSVCGQTNPGTDNCGGACSVSSPECPCQPTSCDAPLPTTCGTVSTGHDNCGGACSIPAIPCPPPATSQTLPLSTPGVTVPFPISTGVPFPVSAAITPNDLRLESGGQEVPAQYDLLKDSSDGKFSQILVSWIAQPGASYALRYGGGTVHQAGSSVVPATLPAQAFVKDAGTGTTYTADLAAAAWTTERTGPVLTTRRADVTLTSGAASLTRGIVRHTTYANGLQQLEYTLVDPSAEANASVEPGSVYPGTTTVKPSLALSLAKVGVTFQHAMTTPTWMFRGQGGSTYTGNTLPANLLQETPVFYCQGYPGNPYAYPKYSGVGASGYNTAPDTGRNQGVVQITEASKTLTVVFEDMWQQGTDAFTVDGAALTVDFHTTGSEPPDATPPVQSKDWPSVGQSCWHRPNTLYSARPGLAKTYRLWLSTTAIDATALATTVQKHPMAWAPTAWYAASGLMGVSREAGSWSQGYDAYPVAAVYDRSVWEKRIGGNYAVQFGWRDFGDRMYSGQEGSTNGVIAPTWYNGTHLGGDQFCFQELRVRDGRWWPLCLGETRHFMDLDVQHGPRHGYWWFDTPAGEPHVSGHKMFDHTDRNAHPGHLHLSGMPTVYLLTGDLRTREVLREVADWTAFWSSKARAVPIQSPHGGEAERDYGQPLQVLNDAYRGTGDPKYHQAAAAYIAHLVAWWQQQVPPYVFNGVTYTANHHYVNGVDKGEGNWQQGTGFFPMYPKADNTSAPACDNANHCGIRYNGTNPWMAGQLLAAIANYLEDDRALTVPLSDDALVQEMFLQELNFVVKYGWNGNYFIYSEEATTTNGGSNLLAYPLAYGAWLMQTGRDAHPEWRDQQATVLAIVTRMANGWAAPLGAYSSMDTGFYGYEWAKPRFWWLVHALGLN